MKHALLILCIIGALGANAQAKPFMLTGPADWELEQFPLPPGFAPAIPYKGLEELRFAPGMFKKDAPDYFTYAFVARLDNAKSVQQADIRNYLLMYFKGLCSKTAADRKLPPVDTSAIKATIGKRDGLYDITLSAFGVFADGAPVTLNMEAKVMTDGQKVYLLFIVSPQPKSNAVWQQLKKIQADAAIPH